MSAINNFDHDRQRSLRWLNRGLHLGAAVLALVILAIGWCVGQGLSVHRRNLIAMEQEAAECLGRHAQIRAHHRQLTERLQATTASTDGLTARLTTGPQESRFIAQLADLAESSGLHIASSRPGRLAEYDSFGELELRVSGTGSYRSLCTFLDGLNEMPRLCHVVGMEVSVVDPTGDSLRVELQLQLLFSLPPKTPTPVAEVKA
jgi:Tfp pilus assembly protein PilO